MSGTESGAWTLVRIPLGPCPSLHRLRGSHRLGSALFAGFLATMAGLDFPRPCIIIILGYEFEREDSKYKEMIFAILITIIIATMFALLVAIYWPDY